MFSILFGGLIAALNYVECIFNLGANGFNLRSDLTDDGHAWPHYDVD